MMRKQLIVTSALVVLLSNVAQAACIDPRDRSTTPSMVLKQWQSCIDRLYQSALNKKNSAMMDMTNNATLLTDHVRLVHRTALRDPIFQQGGAERKLYSDLSDLAEMIVSVKPNDKTQITQAQKAIEKVRGTLPLRGFDPIILGYSPALLEEKKGKVILTIKAAQLKESNKIMLKDPKSGETFKEFEKKGDDFVFTLPAKSFTNLSERSTYKKMKFVVPARRAEHSFGLNVGIPIPKLGRYEISYTTAKTTRQDKKVFHELGRFESTLMQIREETRRICADSGWKIDHSLGHEVTLNENRYGEVKAVTQANDRCIDVQLHAQPHGRAFGADKARKGYVDATVSFTQYRGKLIASSENKIYGELKWGMSKDFNLKQPLYSLDAVFKYFDNQTTKLSLDKTKDNRVTIKGKKGSKKFTVQARKPK